MQTFWNNDHDLTPMAAELHRLIPTAGEVINPTDNPRLEEFRQAANLYYQIFNNGGCNGLPKCKKLLGVSGTRVKTLARQREWDAIHNEIEAHMAARVIAAATEQLGRLPSVA